MENGDQSAGRAVTGERAERPGSPPLLRTEVISDLAALTALEDEWHQLVLRSPQATSFASPAWLLTWYRHFEDRRGVYAVAVWRDDELVGLAPFAQTAIGGRRAGFRLLVSAGTEHGDYGDPLLGVDEEPVAAAIVDHLCRLVQDETAAVNLRRLRDDGAIRRLLAERDDIDRRPMGQVAHNALVRFDVLDDPEAHLERLARQHSIPRRMRRLRERYPDVAFLPTCPDIDGALDAMRDMLARRWEPGTGPRLFATAAMEDFTRSLVRSVTDAGLGRVWTLQADSRPIAISVVFHVGSRYVSDNAAFDPDFASFGLGQSELFEMLRQAHAEGATEVDLRAGDFPYKRKWANDERVTRSTVLVAPGRAGELALAARRVAMSLRARRISRLERRATPRGR